jgi:membrane protein implicated in regulation of membrane protease activity
MSWPWWIVAAMVLAIAELFTGDLIFLMIAVGSVAAAAAAFLGAPILVQALVGGGVALLLLVFVRPLALKTLRPISETVTNTPALVGSGGMVVERVNAHDGRVKLGGEIWSARAFDPTLELAPGTSVEVIRIDGATAIVAPKES